MQNIGFIGTGLMGFPMAKNILKAGYKVRAFNRSKNKAEPLKDFGAEISNSIGELVKESHVVITMLTNDFGYEQAYQKFLEYYVEKETLVILMSSGGESDNILNCQTWCEVNSVDYGVLTGFSPENTIRSRATNALWNYYINSSDYGVVECCHQIFLHGVV